MFKQYTSLAIAAFSLFAAASSHAAYMKLADTGSGNVTFFAGNTSDPHSYSSDGVNWSSGTTTASASNNGSNTVSRSLYNSLANSYSDYSIFFVAEGLLVAEIAFDYIGSLGGFTDVQKITYSNYVAQGITIAAPISGDVRSMTLSSGVYTGPGSFNGNTAGLAFYNDGIQVSAASVAALSNHVPEPGSLALAGLALALIGAGAARRHA